MTERTKEEWGRVAVSLPGWRWMPGMLARNFDGPIRVEAVDGTEPGILRQCRYTGEMRQADIRSCPLPDPDDPATAGCLLALLGPTPSEGYMAHVLPPSSTVTKWRVHMNTAHTGPLSAYGSTLGRACIAAAEALGRWPGGEA